MFIIGERAHSRYFSEDAYKQAAESERTFRSAGKQSCDLYDRVDKIPFDKLERFFTDGMK